MIPYWVQYRHVVSKMANCSHAEADALAYTEGIHLIRLYKAQQSAQSADRPTKAELAEETQAALQ